MNRLKDLYNKEIKTKLIEEFGVKNVMATPKLIKININVGIGDALKNKEVKVALEKDFTLIAGQKLSERKAN